MRLCRVACQGRITGKRKVLLFRGVRGLGVSRCMWAVGVTGGRVAVLCVTRAGWGRICPGKLPAAAHLQEGQWGCCSLVLEVALQRVRVGQLAKTGRTGLGRGRPVSAAGPGERRPFHHKALQTPHAARQAGGRQAAAQQAAGSRHSRSRPRAGGKRPAWSWAPAAGRAASEGAGI